MGNSPLSALRHLHLTMSTPNDNRPSSCNLPEDVLLEILLRLPVKTLLRFKCVCKHWYSLIGSQSFVNRHFGHASNQERLLVRHSTRKEDLCALALFVDDECSAYEEPDHLQMPHPVEHLIGPVNGVFCVVGQSSEMALLNPAMRQFKPLRRPCMDVQPYLVCVENVLGFGLDPLSGDFKIVSIKYFRHEEEIDVLHHPPLVYVYNSGGDYWTHFEDLSFFNSGYRACRSLCNTYLDGVCYWLMKYDDVNVAAILAFDLTTEKFQEIQVPDCVKSKSGDLALYGDSIALLSYDFKIEKHIDMWIMKKEGCWTKSSTVGPFQEIRWPVGFWKSNELLLLTRTIVLTLCNIFTQKLRTVDALRNEHCFFWHWVFSYKESLVSIKGLGDNCKLWDASSSFVKYFLEVGCNLDE